MKKLVVSMFIMVTASFFFVCGASAASQVQFSLDPGETMVVYLDNEYSFEVPGDSKGDYGFFNWTVSETPISHSGLIKSSVVNYAGASMPNITVSAQRDSTYSGNFTFMFDSSVGSGSTVRLYLSIAVTLQNSTDNTISGYMGLTLSGWNYSASNIPNTGTLDEKLNQILDALGSRGFSDYLGEDALFYFDDRYFHNGWVGSNVTSNSNGFFVVDSAGTNLSFTLDGGLQSDDVNLVQLTKGSYVFSFAGYFDSEPQTVACNGVTFSDFVVRQDYADDSHYFISGVFTFDFDYLGRDISFYFGTNLKPGVIWGGIARASDDYLAGSAVNPDQSGLVEDVDNAGQQQQQQEDQLWNNINSYKGDLSFNLDDWSEAAGGLSYVSSIFMTIWNNSPTQVIVLSLMLGIAMLSIGRGAMAAVRVSHNRRNDD